jgi:hypothetical protein
MPLPRAIVSILAAVSFTTAVFLIIQNADRSQTETQAIESIRDIALGQPGLAGGHIGSWRISAVSVDQRTGDLKDFRLESGAMSVAAKTARIVVDPEHDTFTFNLEDVVYTRVPIEDGENPSRDQYLLELEHYVLGPAPYGVDIVTDG